MLEILLIYVLICYILIKKGILPPTTKVYSLMVIIAVIFLFVVFMGFRYYAFLDLTSSATVKSTTIQIRTPTGGEIEKVYVTSNQRVKKGDLLFTVDITKYQAQYNQMKADIETQKNSLDNLIKTFERNEQLKSSGYISQSDYDNSLTALKNQKESLRKSQSILDNLLWIINKSKVYAPVDGVTNIIYFSEGQYLPENRIGLFTLYTDNKFLEVRIPDQLYTFIKVGNFAEFYINTHPGKIFRGRVKSIGQSNGESTNAGNTLNSQATSTLIRNGSAGVGRIIIIEFEDPDGVYIPVGATGQAWISIEKPNHLIAFLDIIAGLALRAGSIESYLKAL